MGQRKATPECKNFLCSTWVNQEMCAVRSICPERKMFNRLVKKLKSAASASVVWKRFTDKEIHI